VALVTLQTIFPDAFPAYEQTHPLPAHVRQAARAIMPCRTAALGGHVQACPDGHVSRIWSNSCRHRSCPQWAFLQVERWLATQRARLGACDHDHGILTIPHDLTPLWLGHVALMTTLLFQTVRATRVPLLGDPTSLGAQPGSIAALHPWGQTLVLHPPIHGLVTGGGRTPDGHWVVGRNGFLLPVRVGMAVCRGKGLDALRTAWHGGDLPLPEPLRSPPCLNLVHRVGHKKKTRWNGPIMTRYPHGTGVATSLARDLRGGPLNTPRLVAWDGPTVTFQSTENQARPAGEPGRLQRMTLPIAACLPRVLPQVPPPHTQVVRSWGLSHPMQAEALAACRTQVGQPPVAAPGRLAWQTVCAQRGAVHLERCPACGQVLVGTSVIPRGGAPPLGLSGEHAA
jgi:hypothetical protein